MLLIEFWIIGALSNELRAFSSNVSVVIKDRSSSTQLDASCADMSLPLHCIIFFFVFKRRGILIFSFRALSVVIESIMISDICSVGGGWDTIEL